MIRNYFLIFTTLIILSLGCYNDTATNHNDKNSILTGDKQPGTYSWTFMVYVDGDNDLELDALNDINEMELVDLKDEAVTIIALVDRSRYYTSKDGDWSGTRLYKITTDANREQIKSQRLADPDLLMLSDTGDSDELNMGDPNTLSSFIDYCQTNFTADRYALILWNHGDGWNSRAEIQSKAVTSGEIKLNSRAICYDESAGGDWLYTSEIKTAIADKNIDLIGFDACYMGMIEVAYQLNDHVKYMVSSQEVEPNSGWVYDQLFHQIIKLTDNSAEQIGKTIIDTYINYTDNNNLTLSLMDLSHVSQLTSEFNTVITSLNNEDLNTICKIREATYTFENNHSIDLLHFIKGFPQSIDATPFINEFNKTIIYNKTKGARQANGLAIHFPYYYSFDSNYCYYNETTLDFIKGSSWRNFLSYYYSSVNTYTIETFSNGTIDSCYTDTYIKVYASDGSLLYENDDKNSSSTHSKLVVPLVSGESYYIVCSDKWARIGAYSILVNETGDGASTGTPSMDAFEPNNVLENAQILPYNTVQDHNLSYQDKDWMLVVIP